VYQKPKINGRWQKNTDAHCVYFWLPFLADALVVILVAAYSIFG
jgi:hypothetical protein